MQDARYRKQEQDARCKNGWKARRHMCTHWTDRQRQRQLNSAPWQGLDHMVPDAQTLRQAAAQDGPPQRPWAAPGHAPTLQPTSAGPAKAAQPAPYLFCRVEGLRSARGTTRDAHRSGMASRRVYTRRVSMGGRGREHRRAMLHSPDTASRGEMACASSACSRKAYATCLQADREHVHACALAVLSCACAYVCMCMQACVPEHMCLCVYVCVCLRVRAHTQD